MNCDHRLKLIYEGPVQKEPVDLWTILHILCSILLTIIIYNFFKSMIITAIYVLIIAIIWELIELILCGFPTIHIPESKKNIAIDIIISIMGVAIYFILFQ